MSSFFSDGGSFISSFISSNFLFRLTSRGYLVETTAWNATPAAKKEKIEECDAVVFCMSQHSQKSKEQEVELTNVTGAGKVELTNVIVQVRGEVYRGM